MSKGKSTRENIIDKAAHLFNEKGVAGASLSDIMEATGLQKGGIYNHFDTKIEISVEAFDYAVNEINKSLYDATRNCDTCTAKLQTIIEFYRTYPLNPIIKGGCPILNTAVEADDTNPELKKRVQHALTQWIQSLSRLIEKGQENGEFVLTVDAYKTAIVIVSTIEGGIAITRSFSDNSLMETVVDQLLLFIDTQLAVNDEKPTT